MTRLRHMAMIKVMVGRMTQRCFRQCRQFVRLVIVLVALSSVIAVIILVVIILYWLLTRWKLLRLAGDRHLLTFRSTPNWGIGNAMFAFASTLAIAHTIPRDSSPLVCFDGNLQLRAAFPSLVNWPTCNPTDVLQLLDAERCYEDAYARLQMHVVPVLLWYRVFSVHCLGIALC